MMFSSQFVKNIPIVGSMFGFYRTTTRVYDATSLGGSVKEAGKDLRFDCTPPLVKYSVLCTFLLPSSALYVITIGNPLTMSYFINKLIV